MQLSVIIVNYNVKYFLQQALSSCLKAMEGIEAEVFVVDNASSDDSVDFVRANFPQVHLIANTDNPGFSIANNQAIKLAKGKYILLLNPDTVVPEDCFHRCLAFMEAHADAGGLGIKMIDGSGNFLPESKRGFPAPFVAFCKTVGLSKFFPQSPRFNRYHLGFLDKNKNNEIDVLAGAFMLMRKETLDKVGWLDETFFMYGEDIDLSYRIQLGGYKNYYFADSTIIHYKGESTKKGSLNYVKAFYNAMIIFAKKHFKGNQARLFVWMLQLAIYFRAFLTIVSNFFNKSALVLLDAVLISFGLFFIKNFWANYYFDDSNYYDGISLTFNALLYLVIWLVSIYLSGGYDKDASIGRLARGLFIGTIVLAAVYGFLPLSMRFSRAVIVLGAIWAGLSTIGLRWVLHLFNIGNFHFGDTQLKNLVIVGSSSNTNKVQQLLQQAQVYKNYIGRISPNQDPSNSIGTAVQLPILTKLYEVNEIIFCSEDIDNKDIIHWMETLGANHYYKILPPNSQSIIGSHSKNTSGELYTIDVHFNLAQPRHQRNKRLFDISISLLVIIFFPLVLLLKGSFTPILQAFQVLFNQKTWISYYSNVDQSNVPVLKQGIFPPSSYLITDLNDQTLDRLNFLYAKDYTVQKDWKVWCSHLSS